MEMGHKNALPAMKRVILVAVTNQTACILVLPMRRGNRDNFEIPKCAYILGHLKTINFPFGTNGKLTVLGVPNLKHMR